MASKPELLKQAQDLGLDVTDANTVAEISAALNAHADANPAPAAPEGEGDHAEGDVDGVTPPEGTGNAPVVDSAVADAEAARVAEEEAKTKEAEEKAAAEKAAADKKAADEAEAAKKTEAEPAPTAASVVPEPTPEVTPVSQPETAAPVQPVQAGSEIAAAIVEGLKGVGDKKKIKFSSDRGVQHRFSVVKNKQGEVLVRENATGQLSRVQLESLEEKEASIQGQEVEEV